MANLASGKVGRISLGNGVMYMTPYIGGSADLTSTSATQDVGYVRNGTFTVTRQKVEVRSGTPRLFLTQFAVEESATLAVAGIEWNMSRLKDLMGAGTITTSGSTDTFRFGGDLFFGFNAVKFVHQMPSGGTVILSMWKTLGQGEMTLNLGDDVHEFPYNFTAVAADTRWAAGAANAYNEKLFQLELIAPPGGFI